MYKFKKIAEDEFELQYKNKSIKFKRTVETAQRIQSIDSEAFMMVLADLSKQGYTAQNNPYIVKRIENGKELIDESNWNYLIDKKKEEATVLIIDELFAKLLNLHMPELIYEVLDINLNIATPEQLTEVENFEADFIYILTSGKIRGEKQTPSTEA